MTSRCVLSLLLFFIASCRAAALHVHPRSSAAVIKGHLGHDFIEELEDEDRDVELELQHGEGTEVDVPKEAQFSSQIVPGYVSDGDFDNLQEEGADAGMKVFQASRRDGDDADSNDIRTRNNGEIKADTDDDGDKDVIDDFSDDRDEQEAISQEQYIDPMEVYSDNSYWDRFSIRLDSTRDRQRATGLKSRTNVNHQDHIVTLTDRDSIQSSRHRRDLPASNGQPWSAEELQSLTQYLIDVMEDTDAKSGEKWMKLPDRPPVRVIELNETVYINESEDGDSDKPSFQQVPIPDKFEDYDVNDDGMISLQELSYLTGAIEGANEAFLDADTNGDGWIDRDEFSLSGWGMPVVYQSPAVPPNSAINLQ